MSRMFSAFILLHIIPCFCIICCTLAPKRTSVSGYINLRKFRFPTIEPKPKPTTASPLKKTKNISQKTSSFNMSEPTEIYRGTTRASNFMEISTEIPENVTRSPKNTTQLPENTTTPPEITTKLPGNTTWFLQNATKFPENTTRLLESTTEVPENTTKLPEFATKRPESTTKLSENTTKPPRNTTRFPKDLFESLDDPKDPTEEPEKETELPEIMTRPPVLIDPPIDSGLQPDVLVEVSKETPKTTTSTPEPTTTIPELSKNASVPPACLSEESCAGRCSLKREYHDFQDNYPGCFCDPLCDSVFQDCCADYDQQCNATWMREKFPRNDLDRRWNCFKIKGVPATWMIGSCQSDWKEDDVSHKCQRPKDFPLISTEIPVIDDNGITFRNRYCALCNGVRNFTRWNIDVYCDVMPAEGYTELEWSEYLDNFCARKTLVFEHNKQAIRYCYNKTSNCLFHHDVEAVKECDTGTTGIYYVFVFV